MADFATPHDEISSGLDFVLISPSYPRPGRSGREFVRTRALAYTAAGRKGIVVDHSAAQDASPARSLDGDLPVWTVAVHTVPELLATAASTATPVLAHSPEPGVLHQLMDLVAPQHLAVWFHGYEVRDYRRLADNHDSRELFAIRRSRDVLNRNRFEAARRVFDDKRATVVFVSEFQRELSQHDVGTKARAARVIPNHIDTDLFKARVRGPEEATSLLLMRSFSERNYGNDIALRALEILSEEPWFPRLSVTIRGFGRHFAAETAKLARFRNVVVDEQYSTPGQMAAAHYDHGVYLCPTRFDTQGVMLGEAMASGMATITHPVAAIGEFTDQSTSLLPRPGDPWAFAEAITYLVEHPELMESLSVKAAERVRRQCGYDATIQKELDLLGELSS